MTTTINLYDTITAVAAAVRRDDLTTHDLNDIAASLDAGEREYVGPGQDDAWYVIALAATVTAQSAQFIADETIVYLGW